MTEEQKYVLSFIFNRSGKASLSFSEMYLVLSMDLNWFTPNDAKSFIEVVVKNDLLKKKGKEYFPNFDIKKIQVPNGFVPSKNVFNIEKKQIKTSDKIDLIEEIINKISKKSKLEKKEIFEKIKEIEREKNIFPEVAALYYSKNHDIDLQDLFQTIEEKIYMK